WAAGGSGPLVRPGRGRSGPLVRPGRGRSVRRGSRSWPVASAGPSTAARGRRTARCRSTAPAPPARERARTGGPPHRPGSF
ncbi:MAG: hypothetical protein AVDCRST_MAG07-639, partial [uncultured Frankineae bacterium]